MESFGYVLVDYRGAPECSFNPLRYFGGLPTWSDRQAKRITISFEKRDDSERLEVTGVRRLQAFRYGVFHDWSLNTFNLARSQLKSGEKKMGDTVQLALRRPSAIAGQDSEKVLGSDEEFRMEQGPVQGFLVEWIMGPYNTVAGLIGSIVPAAQSDSWQDRWTWDGSSWFLHRLCRLRPWAILKCPICLSEYFWNVPTGSPMPSCLSCRFTQANSDWGETIKRYAKWAEQYAERAAEQNSDIATDPGDDEVYSAVCAGHLDAISGITSSVPMATDQG